MTMDHRKDIGDRIRELRSSKGWTVRELAEKSGVTYQNINKIENGLYSTGVDVLGRIADALGVRIELR